ncbi:hypothetical protein HDU83_007096 [Entophlyctis luteolus]|nr:hypothetical protein HDU83_007096 [Entophlyctis luteolus]
MDIKSLTYTIPTVTVERKKSRALDFSAGGKGSPVSRNSLRGFSLLSATGTTAGKTSGLSNCSKSYGRSNLRLFDDIPEFLSFPVLQLIKNDRGGLINHGADEVKQDPFLKEILPGEAGFLRAQTEVVRALLSSTSPQRHRYEQKFADEKATRHEICVQIDELYQRTAEFIDINSLDYVTGRPREMWTANRELNRILNTDDKLAYLHSVFMWLVQGCFSRVPLVGSSLDGGDISIKKNPRVKKKDDENHESVTVFGISRLVRTEKNRIIETLKPPKPIPPEDIKSIGNQLRRSEAAYLRKSGIPSCVKMLLKNCRSEGATNDEIQAVRKTLNYAHAKASIGKDLLDFRNDFVTNNSKSFADWIHDREADRLNKNDQESNQQFSVRDFLSGYVNIQYASLKLQGQHKQQNWHHPKRKPSVRISTVEQSGQAAASDQVRPSVSDVSKIQQRSSMSVQKKNSTRYDAADAWYVILRGAVYIMKNLTGLPDDEIRVRTLCAGEGFGESGLITETLRAASVLTAEPCEVIEIKKVEYDRVVKASHRRSMEEIADFLQTVKVFANWKRDSVTAIASVMWFKSVENGETIINEGSSDLPCLIVNKCNTNNAGEPCENVYFVKSGAVTLHRAVTYKGRPTQVKVAILGPRSAICIEALQRSKLRTAASDAAASAAAHTTPSSKFTIKVATPRERTLMQAAHALKSTSSFAAPSANGDPTEPIAMHLGDAHDFAKLELQDWVYDDLPDLLARPLRPADGDPTFHALSRCVHDGVFVAPAAASHPPSRLTTRRVALAAPAPTASAAVSSPVVLACTVAATARIEFDDLHAMSKVLDITDEECVRIHETWLDWKRWIRNKRREMDKTVRELRNDCNAAYGTVVGEKVRVSTSLWY